MKRKTVRTVLAVILLTLIFINGFGARTMATSVRDTLPRAYSSVKIEPGDTLWSVAETYSESKLKRDIVEYVRELKQMNNIYDETSLKPGAYLMVYTIKR